MYTEDCNKFTDRQRLTILITLYTHTYIYTYMYMNNLKRVFNKQRMQIF